jgi:nicotinate-nucleotide pyrophosphorylase (carboxylating)
LGDLASVIESNVAAALAEDIGGGDWPAQLIAPASIASAHVLSRSDAVVCGAPWFDACFKQLDRSQIEWLAEGTVRTGESCALCTA